MAEKSSFTPEAHPVRVSRANIPGLYDVTMSDGRVLTDLTQGQLRHLTDVIDYDR